MRREKTSEPKDDIHVRGTVAQVETWRAMGRAFGMSAAAIGAAALDFAYREFVAGRTPTCVEAQRKLGMEEAKRAARKGGGR